MVVAGVLISLSWGVGATSAEPTVQAFLLSWQEGQYLAAARQTTGQPQQVARALADAYRQLDASDLSIQMGSVSQQGSSATATFRASINLGSGSLHWSYNGAFGLRETGSTWRVIWHPSVVVPGLRADDRLAVLSTEPNRAQLLDSDGQPLERRSEAYVLGVQPGTPATLADAASTAEALAKVLPDLNESQLYGQIEAAPAARFLALVTLRPAAYHRLARRLAKVPGLIIEPRLERLFQSIAPAVVGRVGTETARVLQENGVPYQPGNTVGLSGLQQGYQRILTGTPSTEVVVQNAAGHAVTVLHRWRGTSGKTVQTTINSIVQIAANRALARLPDAAAIVAVQAGSGRILAVANHQVPGQPAVNPLAGRYRPGQAFTLISTAALLSEGFNMRGQYPCKARNGVGGVVFTNYPPRLRVRGSRFQSDFAQACSTAFAGLSLRLSATELSSAAHDEFGIGTDWALPQDVPSFAGSIKGMGGQAGIAADTIGLGGVRVSPLAMALAAGAIESGAWHSPVLVTRPADSSQPANTKLSANVDSSLQQLMRSAVTRGAGHAADVSGLAVYGQTGSAPIGSAKAGLRSYWFVGYEGNIAFVVVEFAKSHHQSAAPLAGTFLHNLKAGI